MCYDYLILIKNSADCGKNRNLRPTMLYPNPHYSEGRLLWESEENYPGPQLHERTVQLSAF